MSEELIVTNEQSTVTSDEEGRLEAGGTGEGQGEKLIPVSEAIRYRKRAQGAEKELLELKEMHEKQSEELAALKGNAEESENTAKQNLTVAPGKISHKTQGVKEIRTGGARNLLQTAAKQAAGSGSRSDVQEYLRVRRSFV